MAGTLPIAAVDRKPGANRVLIFLGVALSLAGAAVLHFFPPDHYAFYPRCALHAWTGLHCPGCGALRALSALTRGDVRGALGSNLLLTLSVPATGLFLGIRRWRAGDWSLTAGVPNWGWWFVLALILGFGILRNLPGGGWLRP